MTNEHENPPADSTSSDNGTSPRDAFEQASKVLAVAAQDAGPEWDERPSAWATAGETVSKTIYATCYYCSFGVVFPTMLLASLIPKENAIVHGLVDGAAAARDALAKRGAASEASSVGDTGFAPAST